MQDFFSYDWVVIYVSHCKHSTSLLLQRCERERDERSATEISCTNNCKIQSEKGCDKAQISLCMVKTMV